MTTEPQHDDPLSKKAKVAITLVERLGFATIVAAALMYAGWTFTGALVESHKNLIESLGEENRNQGAILKEIGSTQEATLKVLTKIDERFSGKRFNALANPEQPPDEAKAAE